MNSENTFELLPYLDIVNELLETKIAGGEPGSAAYVKLKEALYPFNLPFDLQNERVKLYLKYLSIPAEKLHKTFAADYDRQVVAREFLGLSEADVSLFTTSASGNDLNHRYGNLLPGIGGSNPIPVRDFLVATGLQHIELDELIKQNLGEIELGLDDGKNFYVNAGLNGLVQFDAEEEHILWSPLDASGATAIPEEWFDRALRFIRLGKKTGLSFRDLDIILRSCCHATIDHTASNRIAVITFIQSKFDLKIDETCALFSPINHMGHGEGEDPEDLFNRVFNGQYAAIDKTYIGQDQAQPMPYQGYELLKFSGDVLALENKTYRNRIAHGLGISEKILQNVIRGFRSRNNQDIDDEDLHDSLWSSSASETEMLPALYRTRKLVELLDISFEDLFMLLDVLERDPLVRMSTHQGALIDIQIHERNAYKMLREGSVEERLWLVQVLSGVSAWLAAHDLRAKELGRISAGLFPRRLKPVRERKGHTTPTAEDAARAEKINLLDQLYQNFKPRLLSEKSFVFGAFDDRFARIVHAMITQQEDVLVAKADPRLVRFDQDALVSAAHEAIEHADQITRDDFLGLGLEDRIADKIFKNLVFMGYLTPEGTLQEEKLPKSPEDFHIETDFTQVQESLFETVAQLHKDYVDTAIYPADLEFLGLPKNEQDELYDNLIFNGFLSEEGTLLQNDAFESSEHRDLFEVHARISAYAGDIHELLQQNLEQFKTAKIRITRDLFSDLPLSEVEAGDLIENLRFNRKSSLQWIYRRPRYPDRPYLTLAHRRQNAAPGAPVLPPSPRHSGSPANSDPAVQSHIPHDSKNVLSRCGRPAGGGLDF